MILQPTYGTTIKFSADGLVTPMAHKYFSTAINGVNSLIAGVDLKFEGDKDDIDSIYEEYRASDGIALLSFISPVGNFYKEFLFQGANFSLSGEDGDLLTASINGEASLDSSALSASGQHIFMYNDSLDQFNSRVKVIDTDLDPQAFDNLTLEAYDTIYYKQYDGSLKNFRSDHVFWNKVFFVGDEYLKYCEDNALDFSTFVNTEALFLLHMAQNLPKHLDNAIEISAPSSAEKIDFQSSFKVRTKGSSNQTGISGVSITWESLTDAEAFAVTAFCEARLANRSTKSPLPAPYDRVGEYLVTEWQHTFVDYGVNKITLQMQPKFNSYSPC